MTLTEEYDKVIETGEDTGSLKLILTFTQLKEQKLNDFGADEMCSEEGVDPDENEEYAEEEPVDKPKFKDLGVKKIFILAMAPKTPENYENMKIMITKTKLNLLCNYVVVADLKLLNIIIGIGTHSSKYPCPYGECYRNKKGNWVTGKRRTVKNIKENYQNWKNLLLGYGNHL